MAKIGMIGLPTDINSSYLRGAAKAPARVRDLMSADMMNRVSESGLHLGTDIDFRDFGDAPLNGEREAEHAAIQAAILDVLAAGYTPLCIGGDHAVTYPVVTALASQLGPVEILHVDAHPDLYANYQDNRYSHASPFARIMEEKLATRLVQVGIRTLTPHLSKQAQRFGAELISMQQIDSAATLSFNGPLYISIDLDGLDPSQAPGVSHHEPGGMDFRQLLQVLWNVEAPVIGCDVVEYNPDRDHHDMTCAVTLKLIKELSAVIAGPGG